MQYQIKHYNNLNTNELYDLLRVRIDVFVLEQDCPYSELDGRDKLGFHYIGIIDGIIMATSRILPKSISYDEISIGRVAVHKDYRGAAYGQIMMKNILEFIDQEWPKEPVRISAQSYLDKFYESFGFEPTGKSYLEDGIPHIEMLRVK